MSGEKSVLLQELCLVFDILICFGIPITGIIIAKKKKLRPLQPFLVGASAFVISQLCIRVPILQLVLPGMVWYQNLQGNVWGYGIFLGITAGIFEEAARLLFMTFAMKKRRELSDGVLFGLGHGGIEAMLLVGVSDIAAMIMLVEGMPQYTTLSYGMLLAGGVERIFAMMFHMGATLLIFHGIKEGKGIWYTILAIFLHGILDAGCVILPQGYQMGAFGIEVFLAITSSIVLVVGILCNRRKTTF